MAQKVREVKVRKAEKFTGKVCELLAEIGTGENKGGA
jgi:hypothetical protein